MKWLFLLFIPLVALLYAFLTGIREKREKNEREEKVKHLKEEYSGDPDKLRCVELLEIEYDLTDKGKN